VVRCGTSLLVSLSGITMATVLVNAGLTTLDKILDMNARDLELVSSLTALNDPLRSGAVSHRRTSWWRGSAGC